ncbi:hypothetical protein NQ176_g3514 [Zarea fungicola]|uniref:Uncharacterized protein n=1 Tax=Zarea fungicola TaxID=93591 RepID=A0ACC1NI79_9HYPO|nr:hypothetical protein NQ176_g3514 [Lecanicillium fungicola]
MGEKFLIRPRKSSPLNKDFLAMNPLYLTLVLWSWAASTATASPASTYTQQFCITGSGKKSVQPVPTTIHSTTFTLWAYVKTITTPTATVTPPPQTTTTTVFATSTAFTTAPAVTDTLTLTETSFDTYTITSTSSITVTETETTSTTISSGTTTVPTVAGFTPLATQLVAAGHTWSGGDINAAGGVSKRTSEAWERSRIARQELRERGVANFCPPNHPAPTYYPTKVVCEKIVKVVQTSTITIKAWKTATVTASPQINTQTSTSTLTVTSTATLPDVSSTITQSTTVTITTTSGYDVTSTSTTTDTNTAIVPAATFLAACANDNLVTHVDGKTSYYLTVETRPSFVSGPTNPYDCCVACQTTSTCASFFYSFRRGGCYFPVPATPFTCDPSQSPGGFYTSPTGVNPDPLTFGNSACGHWSYVGDAQVPPPPGPGS